jgi:uncharacterized UBP type Zn finger protein
MSCNTQNLCEFYLSSNLNKNRQINTDRSQINPIIKTKSFNETVDQFLNFVEFIKYEKSQIDFLKSKYNLLKISNADYKNSLDSSKESLINSSRENHVNINLSTKVYIERKILWNKIKQIGVGLLNMGNNCYLNATLQCLAYTAPFSQWLLESPHSKKCKYKQSKQFCALCEVEKIVYEIFNSKTGVVKPNVLCLNIRSNYLNYKFLKYISVVREFSNDDYAIITTIKQ